MWRYLFLDTYLNEQKSYFQCLVRSLATRFYTVFPLLSECYVQASLNFQRVKNKIVEKQPFYDEPLPIICNEAVVLDDSDEEDERTDDDSDDSEVEFELGDGETLEDIIAKTMEKLDIPQQIEWGIENVSQR